MVSSGAALLVQPSLRASTSCPWSAAMPGDAPAVSTTLDQTTTGGVELIMGEQLTRLVHEPDICVLDCRPHGTPILNATRIRLPHVLLRRLQAGTLPAASLSERLRPVGGAEEGDNSPRHPRVVVIPEATNGKSNEGSSATASSSATNNDATANTLPPPRSPRGEVEALSVSLVRALKNAGYAVAVLTEDVESMVERWPRLAAPDGDEETGGEGAETSGGLAVDESNKSSVSRTQSDNSTRRDHPSVLNLKSLTISVEGAACAQERRPSGQRFPVQILPHLYLGNAETAANEQVLKRYNINSIVNVTSNLPNVFEEGGAVRYLRIPVDDNASHNLTDYFPSAIAFINEAAAAGGACLVHCLAGISRSVTVCLAYLMATHRWSLEDAYDLVQRRNAAIAPNFHFMGQLHDFERQLGLEDQPQAGPSREPQKTPSFASSSVEMASPSADDIVPQSCLTPPPTSGSTSPQSSSHSTKSHTFTE